ncbi:MAG: hypothetical protein Q9169_008234 [Polycauliona sp. 2 TL-2023]
MVTYGAMSRSPLRVGAGMLIFKDLRFVGFWVSKWGDRFPEEKQKTIDEVLGLIRDGKFKDVPMVEVPWSHETKKEELLDAIQGTLDGFRKGKGIFKFGDTTGADGNRLLGGIDKLASGGSDDPNTLNSVAPARFPRSPASEIADSVT